MEIIGSASIKENLANHNLLGLHESKTSLLKNWQMNAAKPHLSLIFAILMVRLVDRFKEGPNILQILICWVSMRAKKFWRESKAQIRYFSDKT